MKRFKQKSFVFILTLTALLASALWAQEKATTPDAVLRQYLEAWGKGDYDTMYRLTTKAGQQQISREEFVRLLSADVHSNVVAGEQLRYFAGRAGGDLRIIAIYPPRVSRNAAEVGYTVEVKDETRSALERGRAYLVREDGQWRLPMFYNEQWRMWFLPPTASPQEAGMGMGMPGMGGATGVAGGFGGGGMGGRGGFGGGGMGGGGGGMGMGGEELLSKIIYIQHVDVTQIAALFGVGGQPMTGGIMPGMGGFGAGGLGGFGGGGMTMGGLAEVHPSSGNKVSVEFKDAAIAEVVRALFKSRPGVNYDIRQGVTGTVDLKLTNVDWETVCEYALKKVGARYRKDEKGIYVIEPDPKFQQGLMSTAGGIAAPAMGGMMGTGSVPFAAPSRQAVPFSIGSLTLPQGVVSIVALVQQNALLVTGTEEGIKKLQEIIRTIDVPVEQIPLEVTLLEMKPEDAKELIPSGEDTITLTPQQLRAALQRLGNKAKVIASPRIPFLDNHPAEVTAAPVPPPGGAVAGGDTYHLFLVPRDNRNGTVTVHVNIIVGANAPGSLTTSVILSRGQSAVVHGAPKLDGKLLVVVVTRPVGTPPHLLVPPSVPAPSGGGKRGEATKK